MCGIVGFVGREEAAPILLDGLSRLEYRGYDSAGIAVYGRREGLQVVKAKGRLQVLQDLVQGGTALPLSVVLSAAPCMGSGARMFCAVPLAVTVGSSLGCACPCSRIVVMAKLTSRMPATAPANRMTPP